MSRVLIDTNVFIYAYDPADPAKHERACVNPFYG